MRHFCITRGAAARARPNGREVILCYLLEAGGARKLGAVKGCDLVMFGRRRGTAFP